MIVLFIESLFSFPTIPQNGSPITLILKDVAEVNKAKQKQNKFAVIHDSFPKTEQPLLIHSRAGFLFRNTCAVTVLAFPEMSGPISFFLFNKDLFI